MFWIGIIVGILLTFVVTFGVFMFCMYATGTSWGDYLDLVQANAAALENRESVMQVWHEDECVFEAVFEEN